MEFCARHIMLALLRSRYRRNFCLPTYTPVGWWECDLFEITPAGYYREYEIKVSRADFLADRRKERRRKIERRWEVVNKHDLLRTGDRWGPTQFWYVTPVGLLQPDDLPYWAGLIEMKDRGEKHNAYWRAVEQVVKSAPRLHQRQVEPATVSHARGICYWRMCELLTGVGPAPDPGPEPVTDQELLAAWDFTQ